MRACAGASRYLALQRRRQHRAHELTELHRWRKQRRGQTRLQRCAREAFAERPLDFRLDGDRAAKKAAHWQSVAVAACEQCGRNRVPLIHPVTNLSTWIKTTGEALAQTKYLLSLREGTQPLRERMANADSLGAGHRGLIFLSGPEGGLGNAEEDAAQAAGFVAVSLGERVLRAETAALAALTLMA